MSKPSSPEILYSFEMIIRWVMANKNIKQQQERSGGAEKKVLIKIFIGILTVVENATIKN